MKFSGVVLIIVLIITGCNGESSPDNMHPVVEGAEMKLTVSNQMNDTILFIENGTSQVKVIFKTGDIHAAAQRGTILLLPGWNYSVEEWCTKTSFCENAIARGYSLILPEMEKSVYASKIYPETRADLRKYATRTWMMDTMIPFLQKEFGLLLAGDNNFVAGISTGGRGAALLCLDQPEVFKKGASLSGDFNQAEMPNDNLMELFYGPFNSFKERWTGKDNVYLNNQKFDVPFYIGHGTLDEVVPVSQSVDFYRSLKRVKHDLDVRLHVDSVAAHNYNYWDSEVNSILNFFEEPDN